MKNCKVGQLTGVRSIVLNEGSYTIVGDDGIHALIVGDNQLQKAKLMAAASTLLEALKTMTDEFAQYDLANEPGSAMEKARALVMKQAKAAIKEAEE